MFKNGDITLSSLFLGNSRHIVWYNLLVSWFPDQNTNCLLTNKNKHTMVFVVKIIKYQTCECELEALYRIGKYIVISNSWMQRYVT
jgi:hypothetical protein